MRQEQSYPFILHIIVFVWGFTGILANLIDLPADVTVFMRMGIAVLSLSMFFVFSSTSIAVNKSEFTAYFMTGLVIMLHWFFFFEAVKVSTVSVGVVCLATSTFFTAILEPLFFKRKVRGYELIMALMVLIGVSLIFGFESGHALGIVYGLIAAFLAALFTVLNGKFIQKKRARVITYWEMLGGTFFAFIYVLVFGQGSFDLSGLPFEDWMWLLILGVLCTAVAFLVSVEIMKVLSPFTVNLSVNMEPVYTIFLSLLIFGETELMHPGFYVGTVAILSAVLLNAILKARNKKRSKMKVGVTR